ncbi:MAG: homogentisate 1,2-dioxygenase [Cytophagales bacterium]|nr:homogentisate 1,2-dioxygenase [Cytophagales bacterium]
MTTLTYQSGFGNEFASEAIAGALPVGRNSPQRVAHGLYAELISGTAFTAPRHTNRRTWVYRRQPSAVMGEYAPYSQPLWTSPDTSVALAQAPNPLRWQPFELPHKPTDFVDGIRTLAHNGSIAMQSGIGIHVYAFNQNMSQNKKSRALVNSDAEMLIVPQLGALRITTELGILDVRPCEIALVPRGMAFKVDCLQATADGARELGEHSECSGYICENYGAHFRLPELGPIGSNGLANSRDFLAPCAALDDSVGEFEIIKKFAGHVWRGVAPRSPFNVAAWHGNWVPLKYDTAHFMTIGSISFDHPDPSIFTVLTSPSDTAGVANCDFVIFPPRWLVAEDTFRPPWYHRNVMSEFMGLVHGQYDAKPGGFKPGGASLHNSFVPHGPDNEAFSKASQTVLAPHKLDNTLAFMLESRYVLQPTEYAMKSDRLDKDYFNCWKGLS